MRRVVLLALLFISTGCSGGGPSGPSASSGPLSGRYRNASVTQPGYATYSVELIFQSNDTATIAYGAPASCNGTLTRTGMLGDRHVFSERITTANSNCVDRGTVRVQSVSGGLAWEWLTNANDPAPFMTATLSRVN